jgi:hypothetical protein
MAPDPEVPYWRKARRHPPQLCLLRWGLEPRLAAELADAHHEAIGRIAAAALAAHERGDHAETARLATAAARLCGRDPRPLAAERSRDPEAGAAHHRAVAARPIGASPAQGANPESGRP